MKDQHNIIDKCIKHLGLIPILDEVITKSVKCSLKRKNKKIEKQFDELFENIFNTNNRSINKLLTQDQIDRFENYIKKLIEYNIIDYKKHFINMSEEEIYQLLFYGVIQKEQREMKYAKAEKSDRLKVLGEIIEESSNFFKPNISKHIEWLKTETPFKDVPISEEEILGNNDPKNIYNWKNNKNAMTVNTILKIRENLEKINNYHKLNAEKNIDYFITMIYLESSKVRIVKNLDIEQYSNSQINTEHLKEILPKMINTIKENPEEIIKGNEMINSFYSKEKEKFEKENKSKKYKENINEEDLKNPKYKIEEGSILEKSLILGDYIDNNKETIIENIMPFINYFQKTNYNKEMLKLFEELYEKNKK